MNAGPLQLLLEKLPMEIISALIKSPGAASVEGHMTLLPFSGPLLFFQGSSNKVLNDKRKTLVKGGVRKALIDWQQSAANNYPEMRIDDALRRHLQVTAHQALDAKMKQKLGKRATKPVNLI